MALVEEVEEDNTVVGDPPLVFESNQLGKERKWQVHNESWYEIRLPFYTPTLANLTVEIKLGFLKFEFRERRPLQNQE